jgi:glucose/mannose-6-phosphate isomerase
MEKMVQRFQEQLVEALNIAEKVTVKKNDAAYRSIFISGLGGSGIGGSYVQYLVADQCKLPIVVNKGYEIPAWINKHTFAVCSSYSGNTEETLQVFDALLKTGAKVVCISSGGKLIELAKKHKLDYVLLPNNWSSPRACLGYSVVAQFAVLKAAKLINGKPLQQVKSAVKLLDRSQKDIQKNAKKMASFLADKLPIIYSADRFEPISIRWRQQINENAKMLCWHHVLPEMNHNELVGWRTEQPGVAVIWLRNQDDLERTKIRTEITKGVVEHFASTSFEVWSKGRNAIEQAFYLTNLGDWLSVYLAQARNVDPVEIKVIEFLKSELAKVS